MNYKIAPEITNNKVGWFRLGQLEIFWHGGILSISKGNKRHTVDPAQLEVAITKFIKENYEEV